MTIKFGTDGWRAVISDDFTFANVRLVTQAIADFVLQDRSAAEKSPAYVVGFDTRFLSDRYAIEVATVLAANGITVFLANADAPTPVISYAVVQKQARGGVMITASHNPPRYNGIKLKASYGGSASDADCKQVENLLTKAQATGCSPRRVAYADAIKAGSIVRFDPLPTYEAHLRHLINFDAIAAYPLRYCVDAMHGAGRGYLARLLAETGSAVTELRGDMNPGFGGVHPEPIARYLTPLLEGMRSGQYDLGLATDGDADRIGAVGPRGTFVDPHCIMALALRHLVEQRHQRGSVVKTVSTTQMLNLLGNQYGLTVHETPVGFNYIADLMMHETVLIGGEESGGISILGHIPEGDGVLMGLLLAEIVATHRRSIDQLLDDLMDEIGQFHYGRHDYHLDRGAWAQRTYNKAELLQRLSADLPAEIAGVAVSSVNLRDGVKYALSDNSWLLIRPSGTEPVLRVYAEASTEEQVQALLQAGEALAAA